MIPAYLDAHETKLVELGRTIERLERKKAIGRRLRFVAAVLVIALIVVLILKANDQTLFG